MSYCRWSSDDFQCDLYAWEDVSNCWIIEIAENRLVFNEPLPDPINPADDINGYCERRTKVMELVDSATRKTIGHHLAGERIECATIEEFRKQMVNLRQEGFRFPDSVLEVIDAEIGDNK
jgi:hypothetical protein